MIERKTIHVLRHAQPGKDQETKRSLDYLTEQGKADAEALGQRLYQGHQGDLIVRHSPMFRAFQTGARMAEGAKKVPEIIHPSEYLGLEFFTEAANKPSGIEYGAEFINRLLAENPEIEQRVAQEIRNFVKEAYVTANAHSGHTVVLGTSHGPKVEIGYGALMGIPSGEIGQLAAQPLDGFVITVDKNEKSGSILEANVRFKDLETQKFDTKYLA
ncbi:MAG: histidine phosphatase family protein [Candidatus Woesearchaeota archaeon]